MNLFSAVEANIDLTSNRLVRRWLSRLPDNSKFLVTPSSVANPGAPPTFLWNGRSGHSLPPLLTAVNDLVASPQPPPAAEIDPVTNSATTPILIDLPAAFELFGATRPETFAYDYAVDISAAIETVRAQTGVTPGQFYSTFERMVNAYITALRDYNDAQDHLYTYTRRLDSATAWSTVMPDDLRDGTPAAGVRTQLLKYMDSLVDNLSVRETLDKYGNARHRIDRLQGVFAIIRKFMAAIPDTGTIGLATPIGHLSSPGDAIVTSPVSDESNELDRSISPVSDDGAAALAPAVTSVPDPVLPQCTICSAFQASPDHMVTTAFVPCGHLACASCAENPQTCACPICNSVIQYRLKLKFP